MSLRRRWQTIRRNPSQVALVLAIAAVLASRLPFLRVPLSRDEAGFLVLANAWLAPDGPLLAPASLYGSYWVDRPPLLLILFRLGDLAGGTVGLRLLGTLAAVSVVVLASLAARRISGPSAAAATALACGVMLASPLNGTSVVNGELLAAPFVALGVWAWIRPSRPFICGVVTGAAAVAAVLVKQSFVDVFVFVAVVELVRGLALSRLRLATWFGFVIGASVVTAGVLTFTVAHGTSLAALYDAMLPFRIEARSVAGLQPLQGVRVHLMLLAIFTGGLVPLLVYAAARLRVSRIVTDRANRAVVVGLIAVIAYDVVAVIFGGGYWSHYLVQLIVPVAILVGVGVGVAARPASGSSQDHWPRVWTALIVVLAIVTIGANVARGLKPVRAPGAAAGALVRTMAEPGDTVLSMYGDPTIVRASGLGSPYPYLWTLPIQVRDPRLDEVDALLSGADAPTWIVVADRVQPWGLDATHLKQTFAERYVHVRLACGMDIYLRAGISRSFDLDRTSCRIGFRESWS